MTHGLTSKGALGINAGGSTVFTTEPWTNTDTDREAWTIALNELLDMTRKPGSRLCLFDWPRYYCGFHSERTSRSRNPHRWQYKNGYG